MQAHRENTTVDPGHDDEKETADGIIRLDRVYPSHIPVA